MRQPMRCEPMQADVRSMEALAAHPRIGDVESLRERYGQQFGAHSEGEQQGVAGASDEVLHALKAMNEAYEAKFGHLFVICAQGKSAAEMLAAVRGRSPWPPAACGRPAGVSCPVGFPLRSLHSKIPPVWRRYTPPSWSNETLEIHWKTSGIRHEPLTVPVT